MAILLTNQPYTAGDRGALIISGINRDTTNPPDADDEGGHQIGITLVGETGTNQLSIHFPRAEATTNQTLRQLNIGLKPGDTVTENSNIWLTIDTDPSRGN